MTVLHNDFNVKMLEEEVTVSVEGFAVCLEEVKDGYQLSVSGGSCSSCRPTGRYFPGMAPGSLATSRGPVSPGR